MRSRRGAALGATVAISMIAAAAAACSPSATDGLTYADVDRSLLRDSLAVIATSRQYEQ